MDMEHNFTFESATELAFVSNLINAIYNNYTTYQAIRELVKIDVPFPYPMGVSLEDLNKRLFATKVQAEEAEAKASKPEHRYAIYERNKLTPTYNYNHLGEAWAGYETCYRDEAESGCRIDDGDYILHDEWLELDITSEIPCIELEYEWEADISVRINGSRVDFDDLSYDARDSISSSIGSGDTYDIYTDEIGSIEWDDIANWEEEHDETESEVSTDVEEESTEA